MAFVCLGNICRSPFAASLARAQLDPDRVIASAGTFPRAGRPSPEDAVVAARAWSVDLSAHRSRVLDAELAAAGTLWVFDVDNWWRVRRDHPHARDRVLLLGALRRDGPLVVADPYGKGPAAFRLAYTQIAELMSAQAGAATEPSAPAR